MTKVFSLWVIFVMTAIPALANERAEVTIGLTSGAELTELVLEGHAADWLLSAQEEAESQAPRPCSRARGGRASASCRFYLDRSGERVIPVGLGAHRISTDRGFGWVLEAGDDERRNYILDLVGREAEIIFNQLLTAPREAGVRVIREQRMVNGVKVPHVTAIGRDARCERGFLVPRGRSGLRLTSWCEIQLRI